MECTPLPIAYYPLPITKKSLCFANNANKPPADKDAINGVPAVKVPKLTPVQDLLVYCLRGVAEVRQQANKLGIPTREVDVFICESLFATMTNVNFSTKSFGGYVKEAIAKRENLKSQIQETREWSAIANYEPDYTESLVEQGQDIALQFIGESSGNVDIFSLKLTVLYGIKGAASYAFHALELGQEDDKVYAFIAEALVALSNEKLTLEDWVGLALKVGETNLRSMELLDAGHTITYGHPVPTPVPLNPRTGKAILVSGHDIKQLEALLKQTADTGITVYTHGELLPRPRLSFIKAKISSFIRSLRYCLAKPDQTIC